MKYLVVLALFTVVAAYVCWRLLPYIRGARRLFAALREVNRMRGGAAPSDPTGRERPKAVSNERLLRCAACGTWMPASRAVSLRAGATYCSHACLERAADNTPKAHRSAS